MKKIIFITMIIIASISFAQDNLLTQVTYTNAEKFTDFETRLEPRSRLERLKKDFSKNINKVWKKIPNNSNTLVINFTNIDMAGRMIYGIEPIREVRVDSDRSVLEFDFTIKDKDGKTIQSGHEKLIDNNLARLDSSKLRFEHTRLNYEVALMAKWMKELSKGFG